MANTISGVAITGSTGFRLASVSKPFTAIAIMQLVERGQLNIRDSIVDIIPELPGSWRRINIEHLLTHSSGIYDIINDGWKPNVINGLDHNGLIKYLINNPALEFEPGTSLDYSNTGFMLLATVVERKTGLSFSDYMQRNIFVPANMTGSYICDENQAIKYGDALNYARLTTFYGINTYLKGSAAQVTSRDDFFNFFAALRANTLISAETYAEMTRTHQVVGGVWSTSGYGFGLSDNYATHLGLWDSFGTEMAIDKGPGFEFALLTNNGRAGKVHLDAIRNFIVSSYL